MLVLLPADLLRFTVYRTDKGSLDKGGLPQPAFLNFDAELLYPPAHGMEVRLTVIPGPCRPSQQHICSPWSLYLPETRE